MKELVAQFGLSDDGEKCLFPWNNIDEHCLKNIKAIVEMGSLKQTIISNMIIHLLLNNSPKDVLVYDINDYSEDYTYTIRHYRRIMVSKTETMLSFLEFMMNELNSRKAGKKSEWPHIFLFFDDYLIKKHVERLANDLSQKCNSTLQMLLEEGPKYGICFFNVFLIDESLTDTAKRLSEELTDTSLYNSYVLLPHFSRKGSLFQIDGSGKCIKKEEFFIEENQEYERYKTQGNKHALSTYLHKRLCGPRYYVRLLKECILKQK